jgi:hypothetical protein
VPGSHTFSLGDPEFAVTRTGGFAAKGSGGGWTGVFAAKGMPGSCTITVSQAADGSIDGTFTCSSKNNDFVNTANGTFNAAP